MIPEKLEPTKSDDQLSYRLDYVLPDVSANSTQYQAPRTLLRILRTVTVATTFSTIGSVGLTRTVADNYIPDLYPVKGGNNLFKTSGIVYKLDSSQSVKTVSASKSFLLRPAFGANDDDLELESPTSGYEVLPREERRKIALRRRGYNVE